EEILMQFHIENMSGGSCVKSVTRAIDLAAEVQADLEHRTVTIVSDAASDRFVSVLAEAGYAVKKKPST
ncbi:MAG: heavy-metal-associated domain-containing protein, partial [Hyphomicrobiales bacterium]